MTHPAAVGAFAFVGTYLSTRVIEPGLIEICLDRHDEAVNKLDQQFCAELAALITRLQGRDDVRGILLTSAKSAFLAGADLNVLLALCRRPAAELVAFSRDNGAVLTRLSELPVPIVAAINGYALGGGLEVALCADYRVLADGARVGFPEVGLGVIPGWGGTARLLRLTNMAVALEWVVQAKNHDAQRALAAGVADAICAPTALYDTALQCLRSAVANGLWRALRAQRRGAVASDVDALHAARAGAQKKAAAYPAPLAAVALLERSAPLDLAGALLAEAQTFAEVATSTTARALVGVFLTNQHCKKISRRQSADALAVQRAAVLGAGIMGGGIAFTTAQAGIPVLLKDVAQPAIDRGMHEARALLAKQVAGGRLSDEKAAAIEHNITPTLTFGNIDDLDIVVEAIVEILDVKRQVFAEIEALVGPDTVLASNTSSLLIADIARDLQRPQNVVGMHFFNPVPLMPLVEIIRGPATSPQAIARAISFANAIGKTPLVVSDCAGFLVNRLLGAYMTAFFYLVQDGVDFERIDRVMENWGWPMGPAYLMDVAGTDVLDKALGVLAQAYPDVMATPFEHAIRKMAGAQRYGQKNGVGFYRYETDDKGRLRRQSDPDAHALLYGSAGAGGRGSSGSSNYSDTEIEEFLMLAMIVEAIRCVSEEVVSSAAEVDMAMRLATGFPLHRGGPLWYAEDALGLRAVQQRCSQLAQRGKLFAIPTSADAVLAQGHSYFAYQ